MHEYKRIVNSILKYGYEKENRTSVKTFALPGMFFEHWMTEGFPLLTIRKMPIKSIAVELEGFIKGITSKQWFKNNGCNFWNHWANPESVRNRKGFTPNYKIQSWVYETQMESSTLYDTAIKELYYQCDDLGPLGYSYQMRRFGEVYNEDDGGVLQGTDQLAEVVRLLKEDPNSRRMSVTLWNPNQLHLQALPPCTVAWDITVINNQLHYHWFQRSCDVALGLPADITNNALMMLLLCEAGGLKPGKLTGLLCDCHIYENQVQILNDLIITRQPKSLPAIEITQKPFDIFTWTHKDFKLKDYKPHPKVDMGEIAV